MRKPPTNIRSSYAFIVLYGIGIAISGVYQNIELAGLFLILGILANMHLERMIRESNNRPE